MAEAPQIASVELSIETGPHAGIRRLLPFGVASIGRLESDIVLADDMMVPSHAEATLSAKGLSIRAVDAEIVLADDQGQLRPGDIRELAWPASVTLGQSRLRFDLKGRAAHRKPIKKSTFWPTICGASVLVAAVLLGSQYLSAVDENAASPAKPVLPDALNLVAPNRSEAVASVSETPISGSEAGGAGALAERSMVDQAIDGLEGQIDIAGLSGLEVRGEDGAIIVGGVLGEDDQARWRDVEMWFDKRFGSSVPLDSQITVDDRQAAPDIAIRAVWSGVPPYLVAGDGQRYPVGSVMPGGWKIDAIRPDAVLFQRDRQTFRFEFQS